MFNGLKYKFIATSVAGALLGFAASAQAASANSTISHPGGLVVGGDIGYNLLDTGQAGKAGGFNSYSHSNLQGGGHVGYNFPVTRNLLWGVETGYRYLGTATQDNGTDGKYTTKAQAADLLFGLHYFVANNTSVFGKLGAAWQFLDLNNTDPKDGGHEKRQNIDPEWQIGVAQHLTSFASINFAVDHIASGTTGDGLFVQNPAVTSLLLGMELHALPDWRLPELNQAHPGGLVVGGDIGYNLLDTGQFGKAGGAISYNHSNLQGGGHVGYNFPVTRNLLWGVETGYRYLGTATQDRGAQGKYTTTAQAADLLFGLHYFVANNTSLFGKLGAAWQFLDLNNTTAGAGQEKRQNIDPEWQIGVAQSLTSFASINLAIDHIASGTTGDGDDVLNPAVTSLLLGMQLHALPDWRLPELSQAHPGGLVVGGDIGYNLLDTGQYGKSGGANSYSHSNLQGGGHVSYNFPVTRNLLWGVETGYRYLGTATQDNGAQGKYTTKAQAADLLFGLHYFVANNTSLFGKLGAAWQFLDLKNTAPPPPNGFGGHEKRQNIDPEWQIGVAQNVTSFASINFAVDHIGSGTTSYYGGSNNDYVLNPAVTSLLIGMQLHALPDWRLPELSQSHPGGLVVGGDIGYNLLDTGQAGKAGGNANSYNHSNLQGGGHVGYNFPVTRNLLWGVETGYRYLGSATQDRFEVYLAQVKYTTTEQAVDLLLGLHYFVANNTSLFGKLGAAWQFLDFNNTSQDAGGHDKQQNIDPEWQIGVAQNLTSFASINFAVDHIASGTTGNGYVVLNPAVTSLLLGVEFRL